MVFIMLMLEFCYTSFLIKSPWQKEAHQSA